MLKISAVYLCRRIFFFVSFALIILFRSFACSATIYRRYRESIIVCINIIPFYKNENAPDTSGSKRPVRAYVHVSLDPVAWIHHTSGSIDHSERTGVSSLLSLSRTRPLFSSSLFPMFFLFYLEFHYSRTAPWTFMHLLQCLNTSSIANKYHFLWLWI